MYLIYCIHHIYSKNFIIGTSSNIILDEMFSLASVCLTVGIVYIQVSLLCYMTFVAL